MSAADVVGPMEATSVRPASAESVRSGMRAARPTAPTARGTSRSRCARIRVRVATSSRLEGRSETVQYATGATTSAPAARGSASQIRPGDVRSRPEDRPSGQRTALGLDDGLRERTSARHVRTRCHRNTVRAENGLRHWAHGRYRGACRCRPRPPARGHRTWQTTPTALALVNAAHAYSGSAFQGGGQRRRVRCRAMNHHRQHPHVDTSLEQTSASVRAGPSAAVTTTSSASGPRSRQVSEDVGPALPQQVLGQADANRIGLALVRMIARLPRSPRSPCWSRPHRSESACRPPMCPGPNRRLAPAIESCQERAFGGRRQAAGRRSSRWRRAVTRSSSDRAWTASAPCPGAGRTRFQARCTSATRASRPSR